MAEDESKWRNYDNRRRYQKAWEILYPWVSRYNEHSERAFCKVCNIVIAPKRSVLGKHEESKGHQEKMILTSDYNLDSGENEAGRDEFLEQVKPIFPWVEKDILSNLAVFCKVCEHTLNPTRVTLSKHERTNYHVKQVIMEGKPELLPKKNKIKIKTENESLDTTDISDLISFNKPSRSTNEDDTNFVCIDEGDSFYVEHEDDEEYDEDSEDEQDFQRIPPKRRKTSKSNSSVPECVFYDVWKDFFHKHIKSLGEFGSESCVNCCDGKNTNSLVAKHILNHIIEKDNQSSERFSCPVVETYLKRNFECTLGKNENCPCHANTTEINDVMDIVVSQCNNKIVNPPKKRRQKNSNPFVDFQIE